MNKFLFVLSLSIGTMAPPLAHAQAYRLVQSCPSGSCSAPLMMAPQSAQPQMVYQAAPPMPVPQAASSSSCYSSSYQLPPQSAPMAYSLPPHQSAPMAYSMPAQAPLVYSSPAPRPSYDAVYWPPPTTSQPYLAPSPPPPSSGRSRFVFSEVQQQPRARPRRPLLNALLGRRLQPQGSSRTVIVESGSGPGPFWSP